MTASRSVPLSKSFGRLMVEDRLTASVIRVLSGWLGSYVTSPTVTVSLRTYSPSLTVVDFRSVRSRTLFCRCTISRWHPTCQEGCATFFKLYIARKVLTRVMFREQMKPLSLVRGLQIRLSIMATGTGVSRPSYVKSWGMLAKGWTMTSRWGQRSWREPCLEPILQGVFGSSTTAS